jgi:hypothetical protein
VRKSYQRLRFGATEGLVCFCPRRPEAGPRDDKAAARPLGAGRTTDEGWVTFEIDNSAFTVHGVPAFLLWTLMDKYKYWPTHPNSGDTVDKVNQSDLNRGVALLGA